jgi:hypothetical protein
LTILRKKVDKTEGQIVASQSYWCLCGFWRFEMILLRLSALVLGVGLQMQPQIAPAPTPAPVPVTTEVIAMTRLKPEVPLPDVVKLVQEEVRAAVELYLDGKIDQWYTRSDGKGAVLFLRCKTVDEAKAVLAVLPLVKAGYIDVEYIPVGPFARLSNLTRPQPPADVAAPH